MKIAVSYDHGAYDIKEDIIKTIIDLGHEVKDFGPDNQGSVDYPDFIYPCAKAVARDEFDLGIIICGTGIGASIVANKVRGIRCALVTSVEVAQLTREHNNSNILALAARTTDLQTNIDIVKQWLSTPFSDDERHIKRIHKISEIEKEEGR